MFDDPPIYITAYRYNTKRGDKPNAVTGQYATLDLGKPSEALNTLYEILLNKEADGFHLEQMIPSMPRQGTLLKGIRTGDKFIKGSNIHCIDIDIPRALTAIFKIDPDTDEELSRPLAYAADVPRMRSANQANTWMRNVLGIRSNHGVLITYSHSTMKRILEEYDTIPEDGVKTRRQAQPVLDRVSMHIYLAFDQPLTDKDFIKGLQARCMKDQMWLGLYGVGAPVLKHPWADFNTSSAKLFNEYTGPENSVALFREGKVLSTKGWIDTKLIKSLATEPKQVYSQEDMEWRDQITERQLRKRQKDGYTGHVYKSGEAFTWDQPIYKNGKKVGVAADFLTNKKLPTNLDSVNDPDSQNGEMYYNRKLEIFIDFAHGANTIHPIQMPTNDIDYTGRKYIPFTDYVKPREHNISLIIADPGSGKTYAALHQDVSLFSVYNGGIFLVPTHALALNIEGSYKHVKYLRSSEDKWDDMEQYAWTVMTYDKFYGHIAAGDRCGGWLVVMDEIHTRLQSVSETNRWVQQVIRGQIDIQAAEIQLMTATIEPETLLIKDLPVFKFITEEKTILSAIRSIPYEKLRSANRAFVMMDDRSNITIGSAWASDIGKKSIPLYGKNLQLADSSITYVDSAIEQENDFIFATSVLREGYSLTEDYDIVILNNATSLSQGAQGIAQGIKRVRSHCPNLYIKIANTHFREPRVRPSLNNFVQLAKYAGSVLDYETIKYFRTDRLITSTNFINNKGEVEIDPLGAIVYYNELLAAYEKSSFEAMSERLLDFGIQLMDEYSYDDDLTLEEIREVEAAERGEDNELYLQHIEQEQDFRRRCKEAVTKKELEVLINEPTDLPYIKQLQLKMLNTDYIETISMQNVPGGKAELKEKYVVQSRAIPQVVVRIRMHERAIAYKIYERAASYFDLNTQYTISQVLRKLDSFIPGLNNFNKDTLREGLDQFCLYRMYTADGKLAERYSAAVKRYEVYHIGLFTEEIIKSRKIIAA